VNFVAKIVMAIGMMSASVNAALCATVWPDPIDVKAAKSSRLENALTRYARTTLASDWEDYKRRFVTSDGRIVDNANGGISHSEGQGYGLLMAALMRDRSTFNTIWTWTKTTLLIRDDGLAAWKWSPTSHKVEDTNNATDGDILIAWALGEASIAFSDDDLEHEASHIAMAIGAKLVRSTPNGSVLLPGADGFEAGQPDGMVLNLSYWIYPAFPTLQRIAPSVDWEDIRDSGLELTRRSKFGRLKLPSEWISVHDGVPRPASGFQARFGYNAIRIPLYLAADARVPPSDLRGFAVLAGDLPPPVVDLETGAEVEPMGGGGFRLLAALARCAYNGRKVYDLDSYGRNDLYYPATLGLLSKWFLIKRYPQCL
jgi:endoglucanase